MYYVKDTNYFIEETVIVPLKIEENAKVEGIVTEEQINHEIMKERKAVELATEVGKNKSEKIATA